MQEKVARLGIVREKDMMYYVKDGAVWKVRRKQPGVAKGKPEKVADGGFEMVDKAGDAARAKRAVGGQKRKKSVKKAKKPAKKAKKPAKKAKKPAKKGRR
jgi:hypothetical protein